MVGHTRRFNPSHQWLHQKIVRGEFKLLQTDVQTYFLRRTNMNALGQPIQAPISRYDDLVNGKEEPIDLTQVARSKNGIELQDREFFAAIREGREPNASVSQVLPCYQTLARLDEQLAGARRV